MNGDHENDVGDVRYDRMHIGTVVDRNDPKKLGRVKVRVPGLLEPSSGWAFPLGSPGGGGKGRGFKWVPKNNAEVAVFFKNGDPAAPYYMPAHWGAPGGESELPGLPEFEDPDVHGFETDAFLFRIDDRPGKESLLFKAKKSGDFIEIDGSTTTGPGIQIQATAALLIEVLGLINLQSARVVINGRTVSDGPQTI